MWTLSILIRAEWLNKGLVLMDLRSLRVRRLLESWVALDVNQCIAAPIALPGLVSPLIVVRGNVL